MSAEEVTVPPLTIHLSPPLTVRHSSPCYIYTQALRKRDTELSALQTKLDSTLRDSATLSLQLSEATQRLTALQADVKQGVAREKAMKESERVLQEKLQALNTALEMEKQANTALRSEGNRVSSLLLQVSP